MISYEEALAVVLGAVERLPADAARLQDAAGSYLIADLTAKYDSPMFDNSAVDGFAVRSSDFKNLPVTLRVTGTVFAGDDASDMCVNAGECVRTMTGAMVAPGADAVVMQEDVVFDGYSATFSEPVKSGQAVRRRGGEYKAGDLLVPVGTRCGAGVMALVAGQGIGEVNLITRPEVSIIATGSELLKSGNTPKPGQIFESNSTALGAAVQRITGATPEVVSQVQDDEKSLTKAIKLALKFGNIVVTTGGASVGEKDLVRDAFLSCGVEEKFWKIAMKPGKPVFFGVHPRGTLVFALPGNPVSAQVTFALLVAPAIRKMMGAREPGPKFETAVLGGDINRHAGRKEFFRATTRSEEGKLIATPLPGQESHMSRGVALADRLIVVEKDVERLSAGTIVDTVPWE